jgi:hypothetical protein
MGQFTVFFIDYVLHYYRIFSFLFLIFFVQEGQQLGPALPASEFAASVSHFKDKEIKIDVATPPPPPMPPPLSKLIRLQLNHAKITEL